MEPQAIAPMVVFIVFFVCATAVILLRPLAGQLGTLLEAMVEEKRKTSPELESKLEHAIHLLENMDGRLTLLEERQDFTEELMRGAELKRLGGDHSADGRQAGRSMATDTE